MHGIVYVSMLRNYYFMGRLGSKREKKLWRKETDADCGGWRERRRGKRGKGKMLGEESTER